MVDEVSTDGRTGKETADKFILGDLEKPKHGYKEGCGNRLSGMLNEKSIKYDDEKEVKAEKDDRVITDSYPFIEEGDQDVK